MAPGHIITNRTITWKDYYFFHTIKRHTEIRARCLCVRKREKTQSDALKKLIVIIMHRKMRTMILNKKIAIITHWRQLKNLEDAPFLCRGDAQLHAQLYLDFASFRNGSKSQTFCYLSRFFILQVLDLIFHFFSILTPLGVFSKMFSIQTADARNNCSFFSMMAKF